MRWLLKLAVVVVVALAAGWFGLSHVIKTQAHALIASEAQAGRTLDYGTFEVAGFPYRVDISSSAPRYENAEQGLLWSGGPARVHAMLWKPWHLIAELPTAQKLRLGQGELDLTAESLQASVRAKPNSALPLAEARLSGRALTLSRPQALTIETLLLALRESPAQSEAQPSYDLSLDLGGISDEGLSAALTRAGETGMDPAPLPERIEALRVDATFGLSAALDRFAGATTPKLHSLDLKRLHLIWGEVEFTAQGQIAPDAQGFARGRIDLSLRGSEHMPALLAATGAVDPQALGLIAALLKGMSKEDGAAKIPLIFENGTMNFGPFPLGPAPRLN